MKGSQSEKTLYLDKITVADSYEEVEPMILRDYAIEKRERREKKLNKMHKEKAYLRERKS